ncbi:MAG TPA: AAA family ATPase [Bryobacteraceae bacterium]|nr:AAA family ATPase [Bryobacteraceae bacterium]
MFIHSLALKNVLSFRNLTSLALHELNIVIGPNGAGKSNLIDAISLLQALPNNPNNFLASRGGPNDWIWRGRPAPDRPARLTCVFEVEHRQLLYELVFSAVQNSLNIQSETLRPAKGVNRKSGYMDRSGSKIAIGDIDAANPRQMTGTINATESALAVYRNPSDPTPLTQMARAFGEMRVYRDFRTGSEDGARSGIASAAPKHPLDLSGSNLALVLQEMDFHGSLKEVKSYLGRLSANFEDVKIRLEGGIAQLYVTEKGAGRVSAPRLSDGTLKFLCLMAVLFDHAPAPLVCIEEPEVGLHPDALRLVADALRSASKRMQLIVTTHSSALIDYFSDQPECIIVCEKGFDGSTKFKRLRGDRLEEWLQDYTLGDLWRRGEVGGTLR